MVSQKEQGRQHAFDSFCKKVLKHEVRDYYDEVKRLNRLEISFAELSARELAQLCREDEYFASEKIFTVLGNDIPVRDAHIADALTLLPKEKRDIILLSYFLDMPDREIGEKLNMLRNTVQYRRTGALQQLKIFMEGQANE